MKDLFSNVKVTRGISPVNEGGNTAIVSQIVDRQGFDSVLFALTTGSLADANATFTLLFEHGDAANLSDAAAVSDDDLLGTEALASFQFDDDNECRKIAYRGTKRYLRVTVTPSGNSGDAYVAGVWVLGHPAVRPLSTQAT